MSRFAWLSCFLLLFQVGPAYVQEVDAEALRQAIGLQKAMQQAIQKAEPGIGCILISRSELYRKLGETPRPNKDGKLGGFNLGRAQQKAVAALGINSRKELDKLSILDLKNPATVPESFGSGVLIDGRGLILTNEHVIRGATKIFVRLPGQKGSYADIHAADPRSDLAVLRLLDPPAGLKAVPLGDGGKVKKGQWVISLANPYAAGFRDGSPSASWGIVSNIRRRAPGSPKELERTRGLHEHGTLIQTDARLNLGCSGGALIDLHGKMIGLTSSLAAIQGTETSGGFAVPVDKGMRRIIDVLLRGREVEYGFLGVSLKPDGLRNRQGLQIGSVTKGSPADRAGMRNNDIIVAINGDPIRDNDELFLAVGTSLAGNKAQLEFRRTDGSPIRSATVTLAKFHVPGHIIASQKPPAYHGLRVDYTSIITLRIPQPAFGPPGIPAGVVIREVLPDTKADSAQLKVNDIITHVNNKYVRNPAEYYEEMKRAKGQVEIRLHNSRRVSLN